MDITCQTPRLELHALTDKIYTQLQQSGYFPPHIETHLHYLHLDDSLKGWGPWIIFLRETGSIIGDIGFKGSPDSWNTVEIGYGIRPEYQNTGYATEALQEMIRYCFEDQHISRITAECRHDNKESLRVLEKVQMFREMEHLQMVHWHLSREQYQYRKTHTKKRQPRLILED
ncbi:GNAT family N-acetyltransferase [Alkalicoccus chagannorensis]|uniref:GNAT family N-acetyltransferase n=1 Tax=Alkalicoccus chagannorensis TaxID=427072 RepID=UPI00040CB798|nr:GNAT family N-acetyltransferase [Alkalicoccus chagannorensis]